MSSRSCSTKSIQLPFLFSASSWITWVKRLFTPLALGFLLYVGWQSWDLLANIFATAQLSYLLLTIALLMIPHLILALATTLLLKTSASATISTATTVSYSMVLYTIINRLPARYLPGGIWHTVGRLLDFHTYGITTAHLTALFLLEHILSAAIPLILGGIIVVHFHGLTDQWGAIAILLVIGSSLGIIITPVIIQRYILIFSTFQWRFYLPAIIIDLFMWSLLALAFTCYFNAFTLTTLDLSQLEIAGVYLFSWGIGIIALFAPQGIGVFEVVASHLLSVSLSLGTLAALIAGFRIMALLADLSLWAIGLKVFILLGFRNQVVPPN